MVTTVVDPLFLDTNVLVYANVQAARLHQVAVTTIQGYYDANTPLWVSRQVLREYLATLTRPQAFARPHPVTDLVSDVQLFESRFLVADDTSAVTSQLLALIQQVPVGGKQVHDANIVATMLVHNVRRLLTHNVADFARFAPFITVIPLV